MVRPRNTLLIVLIALQLAGCAFQRAVQRGEELEVLGDFEGAVVAYEEAAVLDPDDAEIRYKLQEARNHAAGAAVAEGEERLRRGELREARASVLRAYDHVPGHADADKLRGALRNAVASRLAPPRLDRAGEKGAALGARGASGESKERLTKRWREAQFWCEEEKTERLCAFRDTAREEALERASDALDADAYDDARDLAALYGQVEPTRAREARDLRRSIDATEAKDLRAAASEERNAGRDELALVLISRAASLSGSRDDARVRDMLREEIAEASRLPIRLQVTGTGPRTDELRTLIEGRIAGLPGVRVTDRGQRSSVRVAPPQCSESSVTAPRSLRYVHHIDIVPNPRWHHLDRELHVADEEVGHWQREADRADRRAAATQREFHIARERDDRRREEVIHRLRRELKEAKRVQRQLGDEKRAAKERLDAARQAVAEVRALEARREALLREMNRADRARDQERRAEARVRELERRLAQLRRGNAPDPGAVRRAEELRDRVQDARDAQQRAQALQRRIEKIDNQIAKLRRVCERDPSRRAEAQAKIDALEERKREFQGKLRQAQAAGRDLARLERELARVEARAQVGRNRQQIERVERELAEARRELEQARRSARDHDRLQAELRQVEGLLRTARSGCPRVEPLEREFERARRAHEEARQTVQACAEQLDAVEHRWVRPDRVRALRHAAKEAELHFVRTKERCDAAFDHRARVERDLTATPRTVEEPVYAVHQYTERTWTRVCKARVELLHQGGVETLASESRTVDTSHAGFAPAGLATNSKAYPSSDAALIASADANLLSQLVERVQRSADAHRTRFEASARDASDSRDAVRGYVRAMLLDPRRPVPDAFSRMLREEYGVDVGMITKGAQAVSER